MCGRLYVQMKKVEVSFPMKNLFGRQFSISSASLCYVFDTRVDQSKRRESAKTFWLLLRFILLLER